MRSKIKLGLNLLALAGTSILLYRSLMRDDGPEARASEPATAFEYKFDWVGTLAETGSLEMSPSPYWWLDSGGELVMENGRGRTLMGELPADNEWRRLYAASSPIDTDAGARPQNLFRLLTKSRWLDSTQEASFRIESYNVSDSSNANESNGVLLLSRYLDEDNLYYAGLRVDGYAVIKKKYEGGYHTLAEAKVFSGVYDKERAPNLIPLKKWLRLRSETESLSENSVRIILSLAADGEWQEVLRTTDTGLDSPPIAKSGYAGIRTDFMDVSFEDYSITQK